MTNQITRIGWPILLFIACILVTLSACAPVPSEIPTVAQSGGPSPSEPVVLTEEQGEYSLGLHLEFLEDPSGELTIDQVSSPAYNARFIPSQAPVPNFGYTTSVYWARFDLDNQARQMDEWLLEIGYANIQYVDLYVPSPDHSGFAVKQTGTLRPVSTRDIPYPHILFNLSLPAQGRQTHYLRFQSEGSMTLPLTLWSKDAFWVQSQPKQMQDWLFLGAILVLLVYHLFLFFSLRDIRYLFFVILLAGLFIHFSTYTGYLQVYIFPGLYQVRSYGVWGAAMAYAAIVLFSDAFWELPARHPKLHRIFVAVLVGWAALMILAPFTSYHNAITLALGYALASLVLSWIPWIASWRRSYAPSRYFVFAWLGMLISLFLLLVLRLGWLPSTPLTEGLYQPGILLMAVGWSMALADRINQLKAETDLANQNLQQSQMELSQILDGVPLGIVVYGKDQIPRYVNQRATEILSNPERDIQAGLKFRRTIAQAIDYFSFHFAGTNVKYPLDKFPIYRALKGQPSSIDDLEADLVDRQVPIEMWASPVKDKVGNVESAVAAFQDITQRKQAESELEEYRKHLESMVEERTRELQLHVDWLSAINQMNQTVARSADFAQIYSKIVEIINMLFAAQHSFIAELDKNGRQLRILAHSCQEDSHAGLIGSLTTLPDGIPDHSSLRQAGFAVMTRDQVSRMDGPFGEHIRGSELQSMVGIPLQVREQILGFLGLEMHEAERTLTGAESNLLSIFSTDVAQVLENASLIEQAKMSVAEDERNRIAREMHDSVAQALYAVSLYADAIRLALQANKPHSITDNLEELIQSAREAMADMRLLIFQLRPPVLIEEGLLAALQNRLESVEGRAGFKTQFLSEGEFDLSADQETELYWIAQEILNNVIKHAHANQVKVQLIGEAACIRLVIEDDGVGFDPIAAGQSGGQGIRNIHERAEKIDASCSIESAPGQGTKVTIEVKK